MADITFIVTDGSMKHDYLFIGLDHLFGSRDHWQYYFLLADITFHWRGTLLYWFRSLFTGLGNSFTAQYHFSLIEITYLLVEVIFPVSEITFRTGCDHLFFGRNHSSSYVEITFSLA